jgi:hypothetical protein
VLLCRKPSYSICAASPEAAVAHSDCFNFLTQSCDVSDYLDFLWIVAGWRAPWRQAPCFHLRDTVTKTGESVFEALNISSMRTLPAEILSMIRDYSAASMIWRFQTVSGLIERFPIATTDHLLSLPLQTVSAWKRGGQVMTAESADMLPVMRLTIDSWGIREIERLVESPEFRRRRTDGLAFVVLSHQSLEGINAYFKVKLPPA